MAGLTEGIFRKSEVDTEVGLSWLFTYLSVATALSILLVLRRPGIVLQPQFWAEDGSVFFRENTLFGFWPSLSRFYAGFPYLLHRLLAEAAVPFGMGNAPRVYGLLAVTVPSLVLGTFVLPHFRDVIRSDYLRILFCLSVVTLPESQEVVGILSNIQWYLAVWALLASVVRLPRSRWGIGLLCLCYALCIFSAPLVLLAVPIWLLRLVRSFITGDARERVVALSVVGATAGLLVITGGSLGAHRGRLDLPALLYLAMARVLAQCFLGAHRALDLGRQVGYWSAYVVSGVAGLVLALLAIVGRFRTVQIMALSLYGLLGSLLLSLLGRNFVPGVGATSLAGVFAGLGGNGGRYFVVSLAMVCLAFLAAIDGLGRARARVGCSLALAIVLAVSFAQSFRVFSFVDYPWNHYAAELSQSIAHHDGRLMLIPINPRGWNIASNPLGVQPQALSYLVRGVSIEQTFSPACNGLDRVELRIVSNAGMKPGPVSVRLRAGGRVIARSVVTPVAVDPPWREIVFPPIPDSKDRVYSISLASSSVHRGHAMAVWRSVLSFYTGGRLLVNGRVVGGDLAFGYGCSG